MDICLECKKPIKGLKRGAKFCSGACRTKYSRKVKSGKIKPEKKKETPTNGILKVTGKKRKKFFDNHPKNAENKLPEIPSGDNYTPFGHTTTEQPELIKIRAQGFDVDFLPHPALTANLTLVIPNYFKPLINYLQDEGIEPNELLAQLKNLKKVGGKKGKAKEVVLDNEALKEAKNKLVPPPGLGRVEKMKWLTEHQTKK